MYPFPCDPEVLLDAPTPAHVRIRVEAHRETVRQILEHQERIRDLEQRARRSTAPQ